MHQGVVAPLIVTPRGSPVRSRAGQSAVHEQVAEAERMERSAARKALVLSLSWHMRALLQRLSYPFRPPIDLVSLRQYELEAAARYRALPAHLFEDIDRRLYDARDETLGALLRLEPEVESPDSSSPRSKQRDRRTGPMGVYLRAAAVVIEASTGEWIAICAELNRAEIERRLGRKRESLSMIERLVSAWRDYPEAQCESSQKPNFNYFLRNNYACCLGDLGRWKQTAEQLAFATEAAKAPGFEQRYAVYHLVNKVILKLCAPESLKDFEAEEGIREIYVRDPGFLRFCAASIRGNDDLPLDRDRFESFLREYGI